MQPLTEDKFERRTASWADLWSVTRRRWKVLLSAFLAAVLTTYICLQLMTDRYDSSASLLVKVGRENSEVPSTVQSAGLLPAGVKPEEIRSEIEILSSRALTERVVDRIGAAAFLTQPPRPASLLAWPKYYAKQTARWLKKQGNSALVVLNLKKKLTGRDAVIETLHGDLQVDAEKSSNVISVHLQFPDPQLGQKVLHTLIQEYLEEHTAVYRNPAGMDFFAQELQQNHQRLAELEVQRDAIRKKFDLSSVPEQQALLLKQRDQIQSQIDLNRVEGSMLAREEHAMQARVPQLSPEVSKSTEQAENPSVQSIRDRITILQLEHAKLASRYQPGAGPLLKNEEELAELEQQLSHEPPTIPGRTTSEANPIRQTFTGNIEQNEIHLAGLSAKQSVLQQSEQNLNHELNGLNSGEDALENVQREIKAADDNYFTYSKHLEEARISEELDLRRVANVAVLSQPATSYEPVYPRRLLIMSLSLPLGVMLGIALVLLLEYMDDTIHSEQDLLDLDFVYLGKMPSRKAS